MDLFFFLRAMFALAVVVGLILLGAWAARKYAPEALSRLQGQGGRKRRLSVVETLVLDPARRLVLVRIDDEERLLLLGEGRELIEPRLRPAERDTPSQDAPAADAAPSSPAPKSAASRLSAALDKSLFR